MFKVNNKDTRTTSMTSSIFVVDFDHIAQVLLVFLCCIEQLNVSWVRTHCFKSVQIRTFCWIEYRKMRSRNNSVFGHFLRSDIYFSLRHYRIDIFFNIFGELAPIFYGQHMPKNPSHIFEFKIFRQSKTLYQLEFYFG